MMTRLPLARLRADEQVAAPRRGDDDLAAAAGTVQWVALLPLVGAMMTGTRRPIGGRLHLALLPLVGAMMTGGFVEQVSPLAFKLLPLVGAMMTFTTKLAEQQRVMLLPLVGAMMTARISAPMPSSRPCCCPS